MKATFKSLVVSLAVASAVGLGGGWAWAEPAEKPAVEAERLVHILGYTASDYGGAVQKGAIVSQSEYDEQKALLGEAAKIAEHLKAPPAAGAPAPDLMKLVGDVRALVDRKADEAEVAAAVVEARRAVSVAFQLVEAPASAPDPKRGAALFAEHCATCHGGDGHADTDRAKSLEPHPANFHDPKRSGPLSPQRIAGTIRFGIEGTAMIPFTFLNEDDRWALGFHVAGLGQEAAPTEGAPTYTLAELATRSDDDLRADLTAAGVAEAKQAGVLADLRKRAPFEDRAKKSPLSVSRAKLGRAKAAIRKGDRDVARAMVVDAYLEGIEPAEGRLRAADGALVTSLETHFVALRGRLEAGASPAEVEAGIGDLLADITKAELIVGSSDEGQGFVATAVASGGIVLREGVEAALLIAALLGIATKAGMGERKRWVHVGWTSAIALGLVTWFVSSKLIAISGASREMIEGVTALAATGVLFYVSYSLLAKKEVARWMTFLRGQVSPGRAAMSLFGVSFLAAYREAFETVLFYQTLLASTSNGVAALVGAGVGVGALVVLVAIYSRAGKFAPPQVFFKVSSYLLYALAVVFAGQGTAALQLTGTLPVHPIKVPALPALGLHPTVETCLAQGVLVALALVAFVASRKQSTTPPRPVESRAA